MKSIDQDASPVNLAPPAWLEELRKYWVSSAPDVQSVAGAYEKPELWMLRNHVEDMVRGRSAFVIAPMGQGSGVGTYRLSQPK